MKITLSGSVAFADRMVALYNNLKELGHEPMMHEEMFTIARGESSDDGGAEAKKAQDLIRWWHDCIKSGDALLVCNFDKKGIKNYIGANTFLEIGFAHVNNKKIFLLNPMPEGLPYIDELDAMVEHSIDGDLNKIK